MHPLRLVCCAFIFLCAAIPLFARDLAIVVERNNPTRAVSAAELEKLLKAGTAKWPDGKKVRIFLSDLNSADSKVILQRIYKMNPDEAKAFVDNHKPDIQVAGSDEVVMTLVANNPGAIGIVNVYSINSQVKVVKIDDKLPLEQGYLLHGN